MLESLLFTLGLGVVVTVGPEPEPELMSSEQEKFIVIKIKIKLLLCCSDLGPLTWGFVWFYTHNIPCQFCR